MFFGTSSGSFPESTRTLVCGKNITFAGNVTFLRTMPTRRELWDTLHAAAASLYDGHEARAATALLCDELFKMRFTDVVVEPDAACPESTEIRMREIIRDIEEDAPYSTSSAVPNFTADPSPSVKES